MGEFADMAIEQGIDSWYDDRNEYGNYSCSYSIDHLHYHTFYDGITVEVTTDKAYLIKFDGGDKCWVAKRLCKKLKENSVYIWKQAELNPIEEGD